MDLKQLRSFVEIVEQNSFTAAAHKLYISQPVLSTQLKELEKETGCRLLIRTSRRMELTEAGNALYQKAKHMLALEESIKTELADISNHYSGTLRLGILPSLSVSLLGDTLTGFCKANPAVSYEIMESDTNTLLHALEGGILDIIFVRTPCNLPSDIETVTFSCEKMVAAFHKEYYSFPEEPSGMISTRQLQNCPILIAKRFQELFTHACLLEGFSPHIKCSSYFMTTSLSWAVRGLGIAIVPYTTYRGQSSPALNYRVLDNSLFSISLLMVKRKNSYMPKQAQALFEYCSGKLDALFTAE